MGPTFILASSEKRNPFCPYRESKNYSSVVQHEARSLYRLRYRGTLIVIITFSIIKLFMQMSISRSHTMHIFIQSSYIATCLGDGHHQGRHLVAVFLIGRVVFPEDGGDRHRNMSEYSLIVQVCA